MPAADPILRLVAGTPAVAGSAARREAIGAVESIVARHEIEACRMLVELTRDQKPQDARAWYAGRAMAASDIWAEIRALAKEPPDAP